MRPRLRALLRSADGPSGALQLAPLSCGQVPLYLMHRAQPDSCCHNVPLVVRVRGLLDLAALRRALDGLVVRHEMLRTTFKLAAAGPVQVIHSMASVGCPVTDLSLVSPDERLPAARHAVLNEIRRPFRLATETPLRAAVVRLATDDHLVAITFHHIGVDEWSASVFTRELLQAYAASSRGLVPELGPAPQQFRDFVEREEEWLRSAQAASAFGHWRALLGAAGAKLPRQAPSPLNGSAAELATRQLPDGLCSLLVDRARADRVSVFTLLLAAVHCLALRHLHAADVCVGTMIAGRDEADSHGAIGLYLNTLPLRSELSGDPDVCELVSRAHQTIVGAMQHRRAPLELVVRNAAEVIQGAPHELLDFMLVYHQLGPLATEAAGLAIEPFELGEQGRVELTAPPTSPVLIIVEQEGQCLRVELVRRPDFVAGGSAAELLDRYVHALSAVGAGAATTAVATSGF